MLRTGPAGWAIRRAGGGSGTAGVSARPTITPEGQTAPGSAAHSHWPTFDTPQVKHMLQRADPVPTDSRQGGPSRTSGTHRSGPFSVRVNEAAALPSPAVVLSARLDQYYGRLRLPPGTPPTSRLHTGYKAALVDGHREPASAGEGLPSSRRHLLNVPRPLRRTVPRGCASRIFTASMAFTVITAARHCLIP